MHVVIGIAQGAIFVEVVGFLGFVYLNDSLRAHGSGRGAQNPEFLFVHEFQHHIRRELEKRESPDLEERWTDYLAGYDWLKYLIEGELTSLKN